MKKSKKLIWSTIVGASSIALLAPLILNANTTETNNSNELEPNTNEWQPESKDLSLEIDNYKTYPLANDKYIVVAKKDRVLVYALSGDLLFTLTTNFLTGSLSSQTNEITRIVLEDSKLYILSSFVDFYNNPVNTAFSVFDLDNAKILVSQYISLRKNVVNNIMELSPNEFLLTSSFNNVTETLANSDNLVFNKQDLSFTTKKFPKAVVNLDKDALLLDLVKVNVKNKDFLVGLVTAKTRGPAITYFSYDSELIDQNPGNYTDPEALVIRNEYTYDPLPVTSNAFEKNQANQKFVSPVFYNFQKFIIESQDNTHILFNFANKEKNNRLGGESLAGNISRNFLIFDTKNFVPNVSSIAGVKEKESYDGEGENRDFDFKFANYTMARNLRINDGEKKRATEKSGLNFPLEVKTALNLEENSNEGLVKASLSYAIKDNKIFSSFLTPSKKLQPTVANKVFSTTFAPNTLLTMTEKSYVNVIDQFQQGQLVALPTKNGLVRVNDHYDDLIGLKLDENNENIVQTSKINTPNKSVIFNNFNEDKNKLASLVAQTVNVDNFITPQNGTTINNKQWIFNDKDGTLVLKANITTNVWYQDTPDTFDVYHVYEGFKKEKDYVPVFAKDNSVALNENNLKNKAYSFKNQYASNVSLSELIENTILIPPSAFAELNDSNTTLSANNNEGTLTISISEDLLPTTLRDSLKSKLTTKYTGFKKQVNSNFYWKFNAPELSTYRTKKASELTVEQAKTLMGISGYDLNSGVVELQPNDTLGVVNVIAKYTNLANNRQTTFEAEFSNFKLPEIPQNEDDAVIVVKNTNNTLVENNTNFDLSFSLTNANAKYVQVEIIPWSTANNAPVANAQIIKSNVVLNNDNQTSIVSFSDLNQNFKDYKLLDVKFFDSQSSTNPLSSPNFRIPDPQIILHLPQKEIVEVIFNVEDPNKSLKRMSDGFKLDFSLNKIIENKYIKIELSELADDGVSLLQPEVKVNSGYVPSSNPYFIFEDLKFEKKYKITNVSVYDEPNSLVESETARIDLNNQTIVLTAPSTSDPIVTDNNATPSTDHNSNSENPNNNGSSNQENPKNPSTNPTNPEQPSNPGDKDNNGSSSENNQEQPKTPDQEKPKNPSTNPTNPEQPSNPGDKDNSGSSNENNQEQPKTPDQENKPTDPKKPNENNKPLDPNNQNNTNNNSKPESNSPKKDWITAVIVVPVLFVSLIIALVVFLKNRFDRKKIK